VEDYTLHVLPVYCIPTIDNLCNQGTINDVELGTIWNITACNGYADFSATTVSTNNPGQTVNYTISNYDFSTNQVNIYIDYNNNGSFTDAGENIASNIPMNIFNAATGNFVIPAALPYGSYRIRITSDYEGSTADPCHVVNGEVEDYTLDVQPNTPITITLNLNLLLEGLYDVTTGLMKQAMDAGPAPQFGGAVADQITVELHEDISPYSTIYTFNNVDLYIDGSILINTIPEDITGSYFIVIKHRNSIETWSNSAILFGGIDLITYDFTTAASQAYGSNQKLISGKYVIYGGDVNQDGVVDAEDLIPVDNDAAGFTAGYLNTDCNGDGMVDSSDLLLVGTNSDSFIEAMLP
jgi:hypothetical protein